MRPAPCELLEWDTDFFGVRIAKVRGNSLTPENIQQIDAWCNRYEARCLYFLSNADDVKTSRLAQKNDFQMVDMRMEFAYCASSKNKGGFNERLLIRPAVPEDIEPLQEMTRGSYRDTRFYFDPNFADHQSDLLYKQWLRLSFEGYAQAVFVAELDALPVGFITCHLPNEESPIARIGLVGVGKAARGQGAGQMLVHYATDWLQAQGNQEVHVVTQGRNIAAQRLYQRCGFLTRSLQLWYHKWYTR